MFWAEGAHLGEALAKIPEGARVAELRAPILRQADPYEGEPPDAVEAGPGVLVSASRYHFPASPDLPLELPPGVIPSCVEDEESDDPLDLRPGYAVIDAELPRLEVNVTRGRALADYATLLAAFAPFRVSWVKLTADWEDGGEALYVHEGLTSADDVRRHLEEHQRDLVENGHLTLTSYVAEGATNVNLSDHKKLVVVGREPRLLARAEEVVRDGLGYGVSSTRFAPSKR